MIDVVNGGALGDMTPAETRNLTTFFSYHLILNGMILSL